MTTGLDSESCRIGASPEGLRRILDIARRTLRAQHALVRFDADGTPVNGAARLEARLDPDDRYSPALVVEGEEGRGWSDDDRRTLRDLADMLAADISLRSELERQAAIVDNLPGLVFERRKTGPAEARYTFVGQAKVALPAVRELMEGSIREAPFRFVHRDDREAVRNALLRSTIDESDLDLLFRIKDFDQKLRWVRSLSVARREEGGDLVWSGLCTDVTDLVERSEPTGLDQAPSAPTFAAPPGDGDLQPIRILIADDLDLNRKLISDMLSLEGCETESVSDGAAAVEAARAKPYDLIFMDMIMPGMDGLDATRAIRALPAPACDTPIVALTAHSFREQLDSCVDAGMNATLVKPTSFDALLQAVATWTKRRQAA